METTRKILEDALKKRILVIDGAMGTMIQQHKLEEMDYRGRRFADWPSDLIASPPGSRGRGLCGPGVRAEFRRSGQTATPTRASAPGGRHQPLRRRETELAVADLAPPPLGGPRPSSTRRGRRGSGDSPFWFRRNRFLQCVASMPAQCSAASSTVATGGCSCRVNAIPSSCRRACTASSCVVMAIRRGPGAVRVPGRIDDARYVRTSQSSAAMMPPSTHAQNIRNRRLQVRENGGVRGRARARRGTIRGSRSRASRCRRMPWPPR